MMPISDNLQEFISLRNFIDEDHLYDHPLDIESARKEQSEKHKYVMNFFSTLPAHYVSLEQVIFDGLAEFDKRVQAFIDDSIRIKGINADWKAQRKRLNLVKVNDFWDGPVDAECYWGVNF